MSATISVVMPARNAEPFIREALDSVQVQTRPVLETIVVDDDSTDGTARIAAEYATVVCSGGGQGVSAARNTALSHARGDYIAYLDADDYWLPGHCEIVGRLLDRFPEAGLAYGMVRLFGAIDHVWDRRLPHEHPVDAFWRCVRATIAQPSAVIVRRTLLQQLGGHHGGIRCMDDYELFLRASRVTRFVCTHTVTAMYRKHSGTLSADFLACRRAEVGIREQGLARLQAEGASEAEIRQFQEIWAEATEEYIRQAWHLRKRSIMRALLRQAKHIPGGDAIRRRWRLRSWGVAAMPLFDAVRSRKPSAHVVV